MILVARADQEHSLNACAAFLRATKPSSASVGRAILMARYYNGSNGQFLSEDPVFLAVGNRGQLKELTQQEQQQFLADPQLMNSYSYARGNSIGNKDPTGLFSAKTVFRGLDYISNMLFFGQTVPNYVVKSPGETAQQSANDSAQFYLDGLMMGAGVAAGSLSPPGIALNVGGLSLYGVDTYCASKQCSNFKGAQYVRAGFHFGEFEAGCEQ
jgi:RHS repeat-associated protein